MFFFMKYFYVLKYSLIRLGMDTKIGKQEMQKVINQFKSL